VGGKPPPVAQDTRTKKSGVIPARNHAPYHCVDQAGDFDSGITVTPALGLMSTAKAASLVEGGRPEGDPFERSELAARLNVFAVRLRMCVLALFLGSLRRLLGLRG